MYKVFITGKSLVRHIRTIFSYEARVIKQNDYIKQKDYIEGCRPSDLNLKSGGPITFDSRSGISSLVQVLF
jgi:hypothetical protein